MPALFGAGLVSMLWRGDSKRLGDLAAGTLVVFTDAVKLHGEVPLATPQAPARPQSATEQASVQPWAGRATRLTPERLGELAALAEPVLGTGVPGSSATQRLLGVAQWLMGRRDGGARP